MPDKGYSSVNLVLKVYISSLGQTWCLILSLVSVSSSPSCDMSVYTLLISATAVFRISCWFRIVHLVKMFIYLPQREWDGWAHKPGLTHLSLIGSLGPSVVLCALSIVIVLYKIDPLLACWFYLYYLVMFLYFSMYMTILYALLVLLVAMLVTTITSLHDLTI